MRVSVYIIHLLLLLLAYSLTGIFGLSLRIDHNFASLIWLPTGISLAALLLGGFRLWPAIFLGALIVESTTGAPFFVTLGIAMGNTLEAVVACFILKRFIHFRNSLEHLRDLFSLIFFAAPIGSIISGTVGVVSLIIGHVIPPSDFYTTWSAWTVGDCLSAMTITPFLLLWSTKISFRWPPLRRIVEGLCATACLLFFCFFVFTDVILTHRVPIGYLLFLPLVWIGVRFGQRATASAVLIITAFVFWGTLKGIGPFADTTLETSINYIKTYIITIALTGFSLSAVLNEKKILEKRKDEFISIASHELKTPLTSITLLLQLLQKELYNQKDRQSNILIRKANKQVEKLTDLVADLLDISTIQMRQLRLRKEKFTVDTLIKEVTDNIQKLTTTHKILIKGRTKSIILADRERIAQVLINLLNNAIKYSPHSNKIFISLRIAKQYVRVDIIDFGIGIDKRYQEKIFERFFRVNDTDENLYPGFGVGLYIAGEIIKSHSGILSVKSTKGKGSTFSFSLPLPRRISKVRP